MSTSLDAVEADTEGRVLLQLGTTSHTIQRGHQHSWRCHNWNNEGTKSTGRGCRDGCLGSISACVGLIAITQAVPAAERAGSLLNCESRGRGHDVQSRQNNPTLHSGFKPLNKARPHCCDDPAQYFWWISILCVWTQMSMSIICHLHTDPHAVTKRTNINTQKNSGSSGHVLKDMVIIKRPIRKCRRMFDCWNDSCFLFIILNKRRWFQKIVFPWLFFPGDGL